MSSGQDTNSLGPENPSSNEIQKLADYIANLSMIMGDADRDEAYKFLFQKGNLELLHSFVSKETFHHICFVINEEDNPDPSKTFFIEIDPILKSFPTTTIILIKKTPYLNCSDIKTIKKDIQILNFSIEGNDSQVLTHIQNCIQTAFASLFSSYQEKLNAEKTSALKSSTAFQLQSKMGELVDLINKTQKTSNIPSIKIEHDPELKEKMDKIEKEKGRPATLDELYEGLNDKEINKLIDLINRWKVDVSKIIKIDRDMKDGDTLEEVNFWSDYEKTLRDIKKQIEAPEVQMTLNILKKAGKVFVTNPFEEDTKTDNYIKKAESYNLLLRDLPIQEMYNAGSIEDIIEQIKKIFEVIRNKMKISMYPTSRIYQLVENLSSDMYNHLLKLLGSNLMSMKYEDFIILYKQCKQLFKHVWLTEFEALRKEIQDLAKKKNETISHISNKFMHEELRNRLKDLKKFRAEHKKLIEMATSLAETNPQDYQIPRDIENAYKVASNIDILDFSKKGQEDWINAKIEYHKVIDKVEGQISSSLIDQLASAQNANEQYRIFEKFKIIIKRPRIQSSIQEYQRSLINSIIKDLNDLKNKYEQGYQKSSAAKLCQIRGIPFISGEIIWMNQIQDKANLYREKVKNILGESLEQTDEGKKVKELIESFKNISKDSDKIIENFRMDAMDSKKTGTNKISENENVIYIEGNYGNYKLKVNFNDSLAEFKEVRLLKIIKPGVKNFFNNSGNNKVNYPFALAIQDAFRTFNSSCQKIKNEPKINKLIANQKNDIHKLIKSNANLTWANDQKLKLFAKSICEKVSTFEEKVSELINKIGQIDNLLQQIAKSPLNKEMISENIQSIQKVIDQINNCSNIEKWIKEIDLRLEQILIKKLEECLDIWLKEFFAPKPLSEPILIQDIIVHKIKMENQTVFLEPSMFEAREYWYNQLHQSMAIILSNKRLYFRAGQNIKDDIFKETTFRDLISKIDQKIILNVYSSLEKKFVECEEYVKTWLSYQVLWDIKPQGIYERLGDDMDKWQQLMNELKQGRKTFDTGDNEKIFGAIIIDYSSVQTKVSNKYDYWHKEIMNQFALQTNEELKQFNKNINEAKSVLEKNALENASSDIVAFITEISQVKKNLDKWQMDMDKYKNSHGILTKQKYKFPNDFLKIENVEKEWNKFKTILKQKSDAMEEQIPGIKARILAEETNIKERIQKLEEYWSEKKPDRADNPTEALNILSEAKKLIEEIKDVYVKNCKAKELS